MLVKRPETKILVDGGDPKDTLQIKGLLGFVDGQTTNPSLIAKNSEVQYLIASGHRFSIQDEYKKIVQSISPLVGDAGVSIEVFADLGTDAEDMLAQGEEMFSCRNDGSVRDVIGGTGLVLLALYHPGRTLVRSRGQDQFLVAESRIGVDGPGFALSLRCAATLPFRHLWILRRKEFEIHRKPSQFAHRVAAISRRHSVHSRRHVASSVPLLAGSSL